MLDINYIEVKYNSAQYQETLKLRDQILRKPLGLSLVVSPQDLEEKSFHLAAVDTSDEIVACLVLRPLSESELKLRQMAVREDFQGKKVGYGLVRFAEEFAKKMGYSQIQLHARLHVSNFYLKLGYEPYGEVFQEVTIPHQAFRKHI